MSRTTQQNVRPQPGKNAPEAGVVIPLKISMALAEGRKRMQVKHIEAVHAAISENSLFCKSVLEKMADSSALYVQWSALCQHKARRYGEFVNTCVEIMSQSAAEINHLISESLTGLDSGIWSYEAKDAEPSPVERRVTSQVISFPERRIATASVLMQGHAGNSGRQGSAQKWN